MFRVALAALLHAHGGDAASPGFLQKLDNSKEHSSKSIMRHEFMTFEAACAACRTTHPFNGDFCHYMPGVDKTRFWSDVCGGENCTPDATACPTATWAGES
eukprot:g17953.t1